jgi:hypothetical protein
MSAVPARPAVDPVVLPHALVQRLALPLVFVAATAYHFLQSRGHATPSVFNDELLYSKLSQAIAAGHGLSIRGEHFFFPAPLASVIQAPAWLLGSMTDAYAAAKLLNAAVMSAAVFPAYWLARRVVRPSFALLTAAAAVATPAMVYHGYLMSEALAYPVFLCGVAVIVRGVEKPSIAVPVMCALAVATRIQFVVLPLAYLAAVAVCARGSYRRQLVPAALSAALVAVLVGLPGALGDYGEASSLGFAPGAVAHWTLTTAALLPFAFGLAILPGALYGLRGPLGVVTVTCTTLFLGQAALISAGEAHRPLERYLFYVTPLFVLAFFRYVERGAPGRLRYCLLACGGAVALSLVSFPGLTGTGAYFFDSVTLSGFARSAYELGLSNASLLYALAPLAVAALVCALPLRRRGVPELLGVLAIALMLTSGAAAYATDRLVTQWSAEQFGGEPLDWLDQSHLGPATYLVLPYGNSFLGSNLESWNRDVRSVAVLGTQPPDPYPSSTARIARDGTFVFDGPRTVVANVSGTQIDVDGKVIGHPRPGLIAFRIPPGGHVTSLARGLAPDGFTGTKLRYQTWPVRPGRYAVTLMLPKDMPTRDIEIGGRKLTLRPGDTRRFTIPTDGAPLAVNVNVPNAPLGGRVLGVKVLALRFVPR